MGNDWFETSADWAVKLTYQDLPQSVVESAKNQIASMLAAMIAGYASVEGKKIAVACGVSPVRPARKRKAQQLPSDPVKAAFLLSSWSMIHDYDDVMLGGHTGHSSVTVPLVLALTRGASGQDFILAQVVANEIAARFNIACALGQTRGQMASHLHLIGAAVARAKFEKLSADQMRQAIAFALASPGKLSLPAFLGSDAKFFCAAWPVRVGWEAIDCVHAGLQSAVDAVTGASGFLSLHAPHVQSDLIGGLGERWFTNTNSFKPYPCCGYISAAVDCVLDILGHAPVDVEKVRSITVEASMFTFGVDRLTQPYLVGPGSSIATLSFSPAFVVASTLLHGEFSTENYCAPRLQDPRLWRLVEKVRIRHSREQTRRSLFTGIPLGIALSTASWPVARAFLRDFNRLVFHGEGALKTHLRTIDLGLAWFSARRQGPPDLSRLTKPLGSEVNILLSSGKSTSAKRSIPRGFAGDGDWKSIRQLMRDKFFRCAQPVFDGELISECWALLERLESATPADLQRISAYQLSTTKYNNQRIGS
ncbi:MmgE/PrpD family protein [Allohahella sp. A8]|uniref:MmgE/PrpD family protein n=1 Tax=Allohahella sp. A8 TaxID=3141461 RepID=UPI003A802FE3